MTDRDRRWPIAAYLFTAHLPFLMLCVAALVGLAGLVLAGVALFGTVRISALDAGGQFLRWLALGYGAHLVYTLLPTCLVHGRTRGEFLRQLPVFQVGATGVIAALVTLAYAGEALLYRAAGWPQGFQEDRLYDQGTDAALILLTYWSGLLVWMATGSLLGAAFYRLEAGGVLVLPLVVVLLAVNGLSTGVFDLPLLGSVLGSHDLGVPAVLAIAVASAVAALAATWALARDMPIRTRAA
ncbi:hypothetical protein [Cryptosporangium minutisporangium]|uniref:ABC transporter permease n=1 Tax=Cryptosporangium minutisporangium TaxID=113569 RepID=A0ABP6T2Z5_9ACTN